MAGREERPQKKITPKNSLTFSLFSCRRLFSPLYSHVSCTCTYLIGAIHHGIVLVLLLCNPKPLAASRSTGQATHTHSPVSPSLSLFLFSFPDRQPWVLDFLRIPTQNKSTWFLAAMHWFCPSIPLDLSLSLSLMCAGRRRASSRCRVRQPWRPNRATEARACRCADIWTRVTTLPNLM